MQNTRVPIFIHKYVSYTYEYTGYKMWVFNVLNAWSQVNDQVIDKQFGG